MTLGVMDRPTYYVPEAGKDGMTELMHACYSGDIASLKRLLRSGADLQAQDKSGFTALFWVLRMAGNDEFRKRKRMFRLLLQHGVSPKLQDIKGEDVLRHARRFATPPLRRYVEFTLRRART